MINQRPAFPTATPMAAFTAASTAAPTKKESRVNIGNDQQHRPCHCDNPNGPPTEPSGGQACEQSDENGHGDHATSVLRSDMG